MKRFKPNKKNINLLIKKTVIDKNGQKRTVYVLPEDYASSSNSYRKTKLVEKLFEGKRRQIYDSEKIKNKYKNQPITWKLMTNMEFEPEIDIGTVREDLIRMPIMTKKEKDELFNEHKNFIYKQAKLFNYNRFRDLDGEEDERFKDLAGQGKLGFWEAVNKYYKYYDLEKPFDFRYLAYKVYIQNRIKSFLTKETKSGVNIPKEDAESFMGFQDVYNDILNKKHRKPTVDELLGKLKNIWNLKTFNPHHVLAEDKQYIKLKGKKIFVLIDNINRYKKNNLTLNDKNEVRVFSFNSLSKRQKNEFKKLDKLPLAGYYSKFKLKQKENYLLKKEKDIENINEKYNKQIDFLKEDYEAFKIMTNKQFKENKLLLENLKNDYEEANESLVQTIEALNNEKKKFEGEKQKLNQLIDNINVGLKTVEGEKKFKLLKEKKVLINQLNKTHLVSYQDKLFNKYLSKIKSLKNVVKVKREAYELSQRNVRIEPMSIEEYTNEIKRIEGFRKEAVESEEKNIRNKESKLLIPGILEKIREYEAIRDLESKFAQLQLDKKLKKKDDEFDIKEFLYVPQITQEENISMRGELRLAKNRLISAINYLNPNESDIIKLYLGLHKQSGKIKGTYKWGYIPNVEDTEKFVSGATNVSIVNYFNNKKKSDKEIGLHIHNLVKRGDRGIIEAKNYLQKIPFIRERYENNPRIVYGDFANWLLEKPKGSVLKKDWKSETEYKKDLKAWKKRRYLAGSVYAVWRKRIGKDFIRDLGKKKLLAIDTKMKSTITDKPKRSKMVRVIVKGGIKKWQANMPKFTLQNQSNKEFWVSRHLESASQKIKRIVPTALVVRLVNVLRELDKYGLAIKSFIMKAILNIYGNNLEKAFKEYRKVS